MDASVTEVVPIFFASWCQATRARGWSSAKRSAAAAEAWLLPRAWCTGMWAGTASTDGGRRAPFELGEDVEREARPLCIEGSAAAEQHAAGVA